MHFQMAANSNEGCLWQEFVASLMFCTAILARLPSAICSLQFLKNLFTSMLDWLWSHPAAQQSVPTVNLREKLKGFHALAKEALTRALEADQKGQKDRAIKLYGTGLSAIQEALLVPVQGSGETQTLLTTSPSMVMVTTYFQVKAY